MDKKFIKKIKEKLEAKKAAIEQELSTFATKDKQLKDDWDTRYPRFDASAGSQHMEEEAGEVGEYVDKLPVEHALETRLRDINLALSKIKAGKYGKCEKCKKPIPLQRLEVVPEARLCLKCQKYTSH